MSKKPQSAQSEMKSRFSENIDRKTFVKSLALAGAGLSLGSPRVFARGNQPEEVATIGIIGLDISHAPAFTELINFPERGSALANSGYKVVAAYPWGSRTIETSYSRIPMYKVRMREMGIEIVDSIDELLARVDYIMLLTNDGNLRLEQALQVMEAGKPMFMDKPLAGNLADCVAINEALDRHQVPAFTSSSLRFIDHARAVRHENKIGEVMGVEAYSPSLREPSHTDLFWYGIHGVETIYAVMGMGCQTVARTEVRKTEVAVGVWDEDRIGTFRGLLMGEREDGGIAYGSDEGDPPTEIATVDAYGGVAYGLRAVLPLGPYAGYQPLVVEIIDFFRSGIPPVSMEESLEIYTFMEAADASKERGGEPVALAEVLENAQYSVRQR